MKKRQAFKIQHETLWNFRYFDYNKRTHGRAVKRLKRWIRNFERKLGIVQSKREPGVFEPGTFPFGYQEKA